MQQSRGEVIWNLRSSEMKGEFYVNLSFVMSLMLQLQFVLKRESLKLLVVLSLSIIHVIFYVTVD